MNAKGNNVEFLQPMYPEASKDIIVRHATNQKYKKDEHLYNRTHLDTVWTIDFTFVNEELWLFLVMDLASKKILGFEFHFDSGKHRCEFTGADVVARMTQIVETYQIPVKVHSDQGGQFLSKEFQDWVTNLNIEHTTSISYFGNQRHESLNQVIKKVVRNHMKTNN